jgi:nitrate reductase molybdenum cofactor assembly chaperone NarJ/NarW
MTSPAMPMATPTPTPTATSTSTATPAATSTPTATSTSTSETVESTAVHPEPFDRLRAGSAPSAEAEARSRRACTPDTLRLLADVLAYPRPGLAERAEACAAALAPERSAAAARLSRFASFARSADPAALEEAYTAAFDLAPIASPYVGDQLFGASRERSFLLSGLRELQRQAGLEPAAELADHVSEVLRLAAAPIPADVRDDLVRDGLAPALEKMLAALEEARHPWADAVTAALEAIAPRSRLDPVCAVEVVS